MKRPIFAALALSAALALPLSAAKADGPEDYMAALGPELVDHIALTCLEHGVDPALALAIAWCESGYDPDCVTGRSVGLMQIHESALDDYDCADRYDPYANAGCGIAILADKIGRYGDTAYALMAYNGGNGYADRLRRAGRTSTAYTREVDAAREVLDGMVARG